MARALLSVEVMAQKSRLRKFAVWLLAGLAVLFLVIQLIPYGRARPNPPVTAEPAWDTPETRALAVRACFDCHSNETRWPWYSYVAPVSWLVYNDVIEGREYVNFSEWDRPQPEAGESAETILEGEMPLEIYEWLHPEARLSQSEKSALVRGLRATFSRDPPPGGLEER